MVMIGISSIAVYIVRVGGVYRIPGFIITYTFLTVGYDRTERKYYYSCLGWMSCRSFPRKVRDDQASEYVLILIRS